MLHRARAERVRARCRGRSCGARAGCSGGRSRARRPRAARGRLARSSFDGIRSSRGGSGTPAGGSVAARRPSHRALEDRGRSLALLRGRGFGRWQAATGSRVSARPPAVGARRRVGSSAPTAAPSASARRSMSRLRAALGDRDQQAVLVLGVLAAERVAGGDPVGGDRVEHLVRRARRARTANSRTTGASCSSSTPSTARERARARRRCGAPAARRARRCPRRPSQAR